MSDWWAERLGGNEQKPPAPRPAPPVHSPYPVVAQPPVQTPQVYQGPPQPQAYQPGPHGVAGTPSPEQVKEMASDSAGFNALLRMNPGGQATREEQYRCPNCGGLNFFSRSQRLPGKTYGIEDQPGPSASIINAEGKSVAPAPICADCGYNGLWQQSSSPR